MPAAGPPRSLPSVDAAPVYPSTMTEIPKLDELLELSVEKRLAIAAAIWDSLVSTPESVPVPDWHRDILQQRLGEDDRIGGGGEAWSDLRRRIEINT